MRLQTVVKRYGRFFATGQGSCPVHNDLPLLIDYFLFSLHILQSNIFQKTPLRQTDHFQKIKQYKFRAYYSLH